MSFFSIVFLITLVTMTPMEAKELVRHYISRHPKALDATRVAEEVGVHRTSIYKWVKGQGEPKNPEEWVIIARSLGLAVAPDTDIIQEAQTLALQVVQESENPDLRAAAALLLRKILEKKR